MNQSLFQRKSRPFITKLKNRAGATLACPDHIVSKEAIWVFVPRVSFGKQRNKTGRSIFRGRARSPRVYLGGIFARNVEINRRAA